MSGNWYLISLASVLSVKGNAVFSLDDVCVCLSGRGRQYQ